MSAQQRDQICPQFGNSGPKENQVTKELNRQKKLSISALIMKHSGGHRRLREVILSCVNLSYLILRKKKKQRKKIKVWWTLNLEEHLKLKKLLYEDVSASHEGRMEQKILGTEAPCASFTTQDASQKSGNLLAEASQQKGRKSSGSPGYLM